MYHLVPLPKLYNFHQEAAPNLSEIVQVLGLYFVFSPIPKTHSNKNASHAHVYMWDLMDIK